MNLKKFLKNLWWSLTAFKTIDELPDAIVFVDSQGYVTQFNKKAQSLLGLIYDEDNLTKFDAVIESGIEKAKESIEFGKPILATAKIPGREFYVEINATKQGRGCCISVRDLTKLTSEIINDEKILKFNGEKNAMLSKLESDIKSPISSISGFSKGLLDGLGGVLTEKQAKYVKIINSNSEELYHFMDKLLEFSQAESSIYESDYHNFDIVETLKAIAKDFEPLFESKKIAYDIDYESLNKRTAYTDYNAIKRTFRNILEVALNMTDSGYISIKISHPDEQAYCAYGITANKLTSYVQITVRDTSAGIAEDEMKYLCEPYAQLEKGKKNFLRALQLGSASILTKRANGHIRVFSEVMKGTKYEIVLPIEKELNE